MKFHYKIKWKLCLRIFMQNYYIPVANGFFDHPYLFPWAKILISRFYSNFKKVDFIHYLLNIHQFINDLLWIKIETNTKYN